jgi:hypothetical protein
MLIKKEKFITRYAQYGSVGVALIFSLYYAIINSPWCDEIAYVDPGAQLFLTGRMVSTAWITNSPEVLWGSSNPGMPLLFAGWFKLIGFGQLQARLLFCILHILGIYFLFQWIRQRYNPSGWSLSLGLVATLLLPSLANAIFQCRLESVAFLLSMLFISYTWSDRGGYLNDYLGPFILGILTIFFGLHFTGFFILVSGAVFLAMPSRRTFIHGTFLITGVLLGFSILYLVYTQLGIWDIFIAARTCHYNRYLDWVPIGWNRFNVTFDLPILALLSVIGLISALHQRHELSPRAWLPWITALTAFVFIPLSIGFIGIYYGNYSWMVALPMIICFYQGAPTLKAQAKKVFISIILISLVIAVIKTAKRIHTAHIDNKIKVKVTEALTKKLNKNDSVAADFSLYYNLVEAGFKIYPRTSIEDGLQLGFTREKFLPEMISQHINCIVSKRKKSPPVLSTLGGDWYLFSEIPFTANGKSDEDYQIFFRK